MKSLEERVFEFASLLQVKRYALEHATLSCQEYPRLCCTDESAFLSGKYLTSFTSNMCSKRERSVAVISVNVNITFPNVQPLPQTLNLSLSDLSRNCS